MIENLKPFEPGQSGNPAGKPKGTKNRSTIAREAVEAILDGEKQTVFDKMTAAIIKKAYEGDVSAYRELLDSSYGKNTDKVEQTGKDGKDLFPQSVQVNVVKAEK